MCRWRRNTGQGGINRNGEWYGCAAVCSVEDGCVEDGRMQDGCVEDGCMQDGCVEDGCMQDGCVEDGCMQDGCVEDGYVQVEECKVGINKGGVLYGGCVQVEEEYRSRFGLVAGGINTEQGGQRASQHGL